MTGLLFIVGHDACHFAFARAPRLNALIAHLAFIPTLHPPAAWIVGHNRRHHGFTNVRGVDYVWAPWSPQEYISATALRRTLYRLYRTPLGIGLYYPLEIWWSHMWRSDAVDRAYARDGILVDRCIALLGFISILASCFTLCVAKGQSRFEASISAVTAVAVPLIVFHFLMSVVIFMHHTHPNVRWFASEETYDPLVAQIQGAVHVRFPKLIELLYHEIFQHSAHHANPRIPLYRLARAQRALLTAGGPAPVRESFSIHYICRLLRECQLYDYETHRWLAIERALFAQQSATYPRHFAR